MAQLPGWIPRKKIMIKDTYIDSDLVDSPVYIPIKNDPDFHRARGDGHDIRFTLFDGLTLLKYEREHWIGGNGSPAIAHFWVKVPSLLADGGAAIYVYYGKPDAPDGEDAPNVWDANFKGVWHLKDITPSTIADSTGVNNGTKTAPNEPVETDGKVYKGQGHDGINDLINIGNNESLEIIGDLTLEGWFSFAEWPVTQHRGLISKSYYGEYLTQMYSTKTLRFWQDEACVGAYLVPVGDIVIGTLYHIAFTRTVAEKKIRIYIDSVLKRICPAYVVDPVVSDRYATIGSSGQPHFQPFKGGIDEVRISNAVRTPAWFKFGHRNINEADNEIIWGKEEGVYYGPGFPIFEKKKELLLIGERKPVFIGRPDDITFIGKKKPILISEEID